MKFHSATMSYILGGL